MSFEQRPRCKVCGALHFAREPHQFGRSIESTAVRKDVQSGQASHVASRGSDRLIGTPAAGIQALPVDTKPKRGRPSTGFDRKEYQRKKAAERRAAAKSNEALK